MSCNKNDMATLALFIVKTTTFLLSCQSSSSLLINKTTSLNSLISNSVNRAAMEHNIKLPNEYYAKFSK